MSPTSLSFLVPLAFDTVYFVDSPDNCAKVKKYWIIPSNLVNTLSAYFCELCGHIIVPQTAQINADYHTLFLQDLK